MTESRSALIVDDERDIRELLVLTLGRMGLRTDTAASLAEARAQLAAQPLRPVPDRHAPAGRLRHRPGRADQPAIPAHAGGDDHRLRQRRRRGRRAEGRRLRLRQQAGRPGRAARPGHARARTRPAQARARRRPSARRLLRRLAGDACSCGRRWPRSRAARRRSTSPANPASARNWSRAPSTSRARARPGRSCRSTAARSRPS